jgi:cell division protein FtsB
VGNECEAIGEINMIFFIRRSIIFFVAFEVVIFFMIYCFGPQSIKTLYDVQRHKIQIEQEVLKLKQEVTELNGQIKENQSSFAQEKLARELLLMKREDEKVYFIKHEKV